MAGSTCGFTVLLVLLLIVTFASTSTQYWVHWLSMTLMVAVLFVTNAVFGDETAFVWDPFQKVDQCLFMKQK